MTAGFAVVNSALEDGHIALPPEENQSSYRITYALQRHPDIYDNEVRAESEYLARELESRLMSSGSNNREVEIMVYRTLEQAYRATTYWAELPGQRVAVRIGEPRGKLDKMASILMEDYRENSRILEMKYAEWA
jgi:hypothetical protein